MADKNKIIWMKIICDTEFDFIFFSGTDKLMKFHQRVDIKEGQAEMINCSIDVFNIN